MGLFSKKSVHKIDEGKSYSDDSTLSSIFDRDGTDLWELLAKMTNPKDEAERQKQLQEMSSDTTAKLALELITDDACQVNPDNDMVFWVESDDKKLEKMLNTFIDDQNLDEKLWRWCYSIVLKGELFLRTNFHKGENIFSIEEEEDNLKIFDLSKGGKTVAFHKTGEKDNNEDVIFGEYEFIHFINNVRSDLQSIKIKVDGEIQTYKILRGESFLETARTAYQVMKILDLILLSTRISRSQLYRLIKIQVGGAGKNETLDIVNRVKRVMRSKEVLTPTSYKTIRSPIPFNDNIYIPVRDNVGEVTVDEIGGTTDVRSIIDVDYFFSKYAGGLKVPKAYLGFEESLPGGIGNTSLTRLDIRYCRTVKRVVKVLKAGIYDILKYYLHLQGIDYTKTKFKICSMPINDAEEADRIADTQLKVGLIESMVGVTAQVDQEGYILDKHKLLDYILTKYGIPEEERKKLITNKKPPAQPQEEF